MSHERGTGRDPAVGERGSEAARDPEAERRRAAELDRATEVVARMGDATWLRGAAAVLLGFAVLTLGSVLVVRTILAVMDIGPADAAGRAYLTVNLTAKLLLAVVAGGLTAKAAPKLPGLHAWALAAVLALFGASSLAGMRASGVLEDPTCYPLAMLVVGPAGVLVGGLWMAARRAKRAR